MSKIQTKLQNLLKFKLSKHKLQLFCLKSGFQTFAKNCIKTTFFNSMSEILEQGKNVVRIVYSII